MNENKFSIVATSQAPEAYRIIIQSGNSDKINLTYTAQTFKDGFVKYLVKTELPIFSEVCKNLLNARDFLGIQLDYALKNVSKKYFDSIAHEYFSKQNVYTQDELFEKINQICALVNFDLTADEISTMINCDIDLVQKIAPILEDNIHFLNQ